MARLDIKNVPDSLYKKLQTRAKRHGRSVSREAIHVLSKALEPQAPYSIPDLQGLDKEIWKDTDPVEHVSREGGSWNRH